jgi:hypothetical protein
MSKRTQYVVGYRLDDGSLNNSFSCATEQEALAKARARAKNDTPPYYNFVVTRRVEEDLYMVRMTAPPPPPEPKLEEVRVVERD